VDKYAKKEYVKHKLAFQFTASHDLQKLHFLIAFKKVWGKRMTGKDDKEGFHKLLSRENVHGLLLQLSI